MRPRVARLAETRAGVGCIVPSQGCFANSCLRVVAFFSEQTPCAGHLPKKCRRASTVRRPWRDHRYMNAPADMECEEAGSNVLQRCSFRPLCGDLGFRQNAALRSERSGGDGAERAPSPSEPNELSSYCCRYGDQTIAAKYSNCQLRPRKVFVLR